MNIRVLGFKGRDDLILPDGQVIITPAFDGDGDFFSGGGTAGSSVATGASAAGASAAGASVATGAGNRRRSTKAQQNQSGKQNEQFLLHFFFSF